MGTRTYSRRAADGTRVLTALGRRRAGIVGQDVDIFGDPIPDVNPPAPAPVTTEAANVLVLGKNRADWDSAMTRFKAIPLDRTLPNEQLVLLDDNYAVLSREDGDRNSVSEENVDPQVLQQVKWLTHNHPDSVPLSTADLRNIMANGRSGIEARCNPITPAQRTTMNEYFQSVRDDLVRTQQTKLSKQARANVDALMQVVDTFLTNPTATQWTFIAHNSDSTPQFRNAGLMENKVRKRITELQNTGTVDAILRASMLRAKTEKERRLVRTTYTILLQQAALNMTLADYPAITHGIVFE